MIQFAPLTGFLILLLYIKIIESFVVTQFKEVMMTKFHLNTGKRSSKLLRGGIK